MLSAPQKQAAQRCRGLYDVVHSSGIRTAPFEPRIDVIGCTPLQPAERLTLAVAELRKVRTVLGQRSYGLLVSLVAYDRSLAELGSLRRPSDTIINMMRMGLDDLAEHWRYVGRKLV